MKPFRVSFGVVCPFRQASPRTKTALEAYSCVCSEIYMQDIVEEFVAYGVDPLQSDIEMPKVPKGQSSSMLMRHPFKFDHNFHGFDVPNAAWIKLIDRAMKEIVGDYSIADSEKLFASFPDREKKKLNRVIF